MLATVGVVMFVFGDVLEIAFVEEACTGYEYSTELVGLLVTPEVDVKTEEGFSVWIKPFSDLTPGQRAPNGGRPYVCVG